MLRVRRSSVRARCADVLVAFLRPFVRSFYLIEIGLGGEKRVDDINVRLLKLMSALLK